MFNYIVLIESIIIALMFSEYWGCFKHSDFVEPQAFSYLALFSFQVTS